MRFCRFLFLFSVVAIFVGCVMYESEKPSDGGAKISIEKARRRFDENAGEFNLPSQLMPSIGGVAVGRSTSLPQIILTPQWQQASAYRVDSLYIVDAPVTMNAEMIVRRYDMIPDEDLMLYLADSESRLVQVETEAGVVHMFMMTMVPDLSGLYNPATNTKYLHPANDFSGLVFFSELDGTYGEVYEYLGGVRICRMFTAPQASLSLEELANLAGDDHIILRNSLILHNGVGTRSYNSEQLGYNDGTGSDENPLEAEPVIVYPKCRGCWRQVIDCVCPPPPPPPVEHKCTYCGSPYCYGSCRPNPGGGPGNHPPSNPQPNDPPPREEEDNNREITSVTIKVSQSGTVMLGSRYTLSVEILPQNTAENIAYVEYYANDIFIGRDSGSGSFDFMAQALGDHRFQACVVVVGRENDAPIESDYSDVVTHRFPTADEIEERFGEQMNELWELSKAIGSAEYTFEIAAVIWLDTRIGYGDPFTLEHRPSEAYPYTLQEFGAPLGEYQDEVYGGDPRLGSKWVVGIFHTHPSWHNAPFPRVVGRSAEDTPPANGIPAWVMDYEADEWDAYGVPYITPRGARTASGKLERYGGNGRIK